MEGYKICCRWYIRSAVGRPWSYDAYKFSARCEVLSFRFSYVLPGIVCVCFSAVLLKLQY